MLKRKQPYVVTLSKNATSEDAATCGRFGYFERHAKILELLSNANEISSRQSAARLIAPAIGTRCTAQLLNLCKRQIGLEAITHTS